MTNLNYTSLLLLGVLALHSCKLQKVNISKTNKKNEVNTIIRYETIRDSAYCKLASSNNIEYSFYNLPFFKTDKEIVLFNGGGIYQGFSFFDKDNLQIQLKKVAQNRGKWCVEEETYSGLIGLNHEVTYNEKDLVSFKLYYEEYSGSVHTYTEYYNYSIYNQKINKRTDKGSVLNIFNKEKTEGLISKINTYILKDIRNTLINGHDNIGEEISGIRKRNIEENIKKGTYEITELPTEWGIEVVDNEVGIIFYEVKVPNILTDASNNYSIFFTIKELHPYLVKSFENRI